MTTLAIINNSTVLTDAQVQTIVDPLQYQITVHFVPLWGRYAKVKFIPKGQVPPPGSWWLTIFDTSDQAGALGYHDLTPEGLPLGKVFAKSDMDNGYSWTVTVSHEALEMLGDPFINIVALDESNTRAYAYEACDACEADNLGYKVGGVLLSDFVTPQWFIPSLTAANAKFDFMGHIKAPLTLLPGGYIGYFDYTSTAGWQQLNADLKSPTSRRLKLRSKKMNGGLRRSEVLEHILIR
jgi:hypothetical protein